MAAAPGTGPALLVEQQLRANRTDWSKSPMLRMSKTWICRGLGKYNGACMRTAPLPQSAGCSSRHACCLHMHVGVTRGAQVLHGQLGILLLILLQA